MFSDEPSNAEKSKNSACNCIKYSNVDFRYLGKMWKKKILSDGLLKGGNCYTDFYIFIEGVLINQQ